MNLIIRKETPADYTPVSDVMKSAFPFRVELGHTFNEWVVVENTRESESYINDLTLVAEINGQVVGHIMFTPMKVKGSTACYESIALAPVSVHADYQKQGIGKALVHAGIEQARSLGYKSIIVLGDPKYYTKFGFELASKWRIGTNPNFNDSYLFALELVKGGLKGISGVVEYCPTFYNEKGELI